MLRIALGLILFSSTIITAQNPIDTLEFYAKKMLNDPIESERLESEDRVSFILDTLLKSTNSWDISFAQIKSLSILTSPDNRFKLYTWNVPLDDGTYYFFGRVQLRSHRKFPYSVIDLKDASGEITKASSKILQADQWFGALYYNIIRKSSKRKVYYTLLGWDGNSSMSNKKLIDVMLITPKNTITFGAAIFDDTKGLRNRVFFEHSERVTMSLRYQENKDWIVFDHLAPSQTSLEGQYEFYGPDFTFDAFQWEKNRWVFKANVDVRNEGLNEGKQTKKPERGLPAPKQK